MEQGILTTIYWYMSAGLNRDSWTLLPCRSESGFDLILFSFLVQSRTYDYGDSGHNESTDGDDFETNVTQMSR